MRDELRHSRGTYSASRSRAFPLNNRSKQARALSRFNRRHAEPDKDFCDCCGELRVLTGLGNMACADCTAERMELYFSKGLR